MTAIPSATEAPVITDSRQLVETFAAGCKPVDAWRTGTEHEKFVVDVHGRPGSYETAIRPLLERLAARHGWEPVLENGQPIALKRGRAAISLEPGGQFELSGAPLATLHETADELDSHFAEAESIARELGLEFLIQGVHPAWRREDMPWMPKGRYAIMRRYMPLKGSLGLDMMLRTCTVQANLDFSSERDMIEKFRLSLALQPLATALFANSRNLEGRDTGYASWRARIWTDTDPDRCGVPGFVFENGMGFERYADWALDVPMYFVYRQGRYVDAAGQSFRDFLEGRLPALPGERPTLADWQDHLTTLFPDVRLKTYLEMRGADAGSRPMLLALPAFWTGLLYSASASAAAWDEVKGWPVEALRQLRLDAARQGLDASLPGRGSLRDLAKIILPLARAGLQERARLDSKGQDESQYLDALAAFVR